VRGPDHVAQCDGANLGALVMRSGGADLGDRTPPGRSGLAARLSRLRLGGRQPDCGLGAPPLNIVYTPMPDTTSTLDVVDMPELIVQGGALYDGENIWAPTDFKLTTSDGDDADWTRGRSVPSANPKDQSRKFVVLPCSKEMLGANKSGEVNLTGAGTGVKIGARPSTAFKGHSVNPPSGDHCLDQFGLETMILMIAMCRLANANDTRVTKPGDQRLQFGSRW